MLEPMLRDLRREKEILLMTHIVIGYPSFDDSRRIVEAMVDAGVDLMELQIPFSEPIADGPAILRANQRSLQEGSTVEKCMRFAEEMARSFGIPFLLMTYYNILFKYGVSEFAKAMSDAGLHGAIVPDIPPEEAGDYLAAMEAHEQAPVFIYSPNTSAERMKLIAESAKGFIYCVARKGVTGAETSFSDQLESYIARCRAATDLPLAVGFGVKDAGDVDFLRGKADIAVVGTQAIRVLETQGVGEIRGYIEGLRG